MKITVGIPTVKGRESILINCLSSVLNQSYTNWDLVICTTNLESAVQDRESPNVLNNFLKSIEFVGHNVTVLHDKMQAGPGYAMQQIIDYTLSDLVLRVDDDVILTSTCLEKLLETYIEYRSKNVRLVSGVVNGFGSPFIDFLYYWSTDREIPKHLIGNGNYNYMNDNFTHHSTLAQKAIAEVDFVSGYCLLFDKNLLFNERYVDNNSPKHHREDWYMSLKLKALGYRMLVRMDVVAFHHHRYNVEEEDYSDTFRSSRAREDIQLFEDFRRKVVLPEERHIGVVEYVA